MDYRIIIGVILVLTGITLEVVYSPRLEFVKNKILLFYNLPFTQNRVYIILI